MDQSISKSSYRALYVRLDRRPTRYQYLVSYSLVKSEDNNPTARFVNLSDQGRDWGPSNAERRHSLVASGVVQAPFDIQVGAVWTLRSKLPFNAVAGRDPRCQPRARVRGHRRVAAGIRSARADLP